ncbi:MAG: DoxX family membrane protein [Elusimicrobia bacterium]|nr:DoxX family membrane protein [Elusimicrobiota bacterium]
MDRQDSPDRPIGAAPGSWAGLLARLVLGLVFVASGTMKASAPAEEFALVIEYYRLVPSADLILIIAAFLPWFELLTGYALILGFLVRPAALAAGAMNLVFILAILSTKARGLELPNCGCFGWGLHPTPNQTLALDFFLAAAAVQAFRKGAVRLSLDNWRGAGYN